MTRLSENELKQIIASNLRRYRKERGLTQEQVSYLVGMKRAAYAKYETGVSITVLNLVKLAKVLDVSLDALVKPTDEDI